ncbi:ParM/StbA family protein [Sporosarcina gallistercoris]|uniref:ParM/StbA family protein n=1 Tax=Sporosarcina gallistercoris TaxID=2762245 RepID=UPI003D2DBC0A
MSKLILGIDAGNHTAKIAGPYGMDSYRTAICDWFERDIVESHGADDMEFEIDGRKGFAGSIAVYEDEFGRASMFGDTKAHEDTKIRVLLAIYRYGKKYGIDITDVSLVTGQPIVSHKPTDKEAIQQMLVGTHTLHVNGETQSIHIVETGVAAEGSGAYWSSPEGGTVRIIDVGSGTVNAATIIDKRYINNASDTFNFGMETVNNKEDLASVARGIIRNTSRLKWHRNDSVYVCGGIAKDMLPFIQSHYSSAQLLQPMLQEGNAVTVADPVYANSIGFYKLAKGAFG